MLKVLALVFTLCLGVALGRPGAIKQVDTKSTLSELNSQKNQAEENIMPILFQADPVTTTTEEPWYKWFGDKVAIRLSSMGEYAKDPATGGGNDGKTYNKLNFGFGPDKDYNIYLDYLMNKFSEVSEGNYGTVAIGYHSPLPYLGDISIRASDDVSTFGKGAVNWRLDLSDEAWRNWVKS